MYWCKTENEHCDLVAKLSLSCNMSSKNRFFVFCQRANVSCTLSSAMLYVIDKKMDIKVQLAV